MILADSSAIIAYLQAEKGKDFVKPYLDDPINNLHINSVNLIEIILKLKQHNIHSEKILSRLDRLKLSIVDCTREIAFIATEISHPKNMFLSLGDRICLATAIHHKSPVLTADASWKKLKLPVEVITIRQGYPKNARALRV